LQSLGMTVVVDLALVVALVK